MKTKIMILIGFLTGVNWVQAQESFHQELSVNIGAGISTLQYNPSMGKKDAGWGERIGIGYTYFLSSQWGITTGLDLAFYNSKMTADRMQLEYLISTPQGLTDNFYLRADYAGYEEKQKTAFLQLPVMAQFQMPVQRNFFYISGGLKIGFPLSGTYQSSIQTLTMTGYSDYTGQVYENMPEYGFDTYSGTQASSDLDLNMAYILALETGMKWRLSEKSSLYTGIYLDYGLNNICKATQNLIVFNSDFTRDYQYNSSLHSQSEGNSLVGKVYPLSIGIKIRLGLGL
jgi:hypothetical protein